MSKKLSAVLLAVLLGGWLLIVLIVGWGNYYDWFQHHKGLMWTLKIIEFLLLFPLLLKDDK